MEMCSELLESHARCLEGVCLRCDSKEVEQVSHIAFVDLWLATRHFDSTLHGHMQGRTASGSKNLARGSPPPAGHATDSRGQRELVPADDLRGQSGDGKPIIWKVVLSVTVIIGGS